MDINSILKDAKTMRETTEKIIPEQCAKAWERIQKNITNAAEKGYFYTYILSEEYLPIPYKELVKEFKSKGYRVKFSRCNYRNGFFLYVYWK